MELNIDIPPAAETPTPSGVVSSTNRDKITALRDAILGKLTYSVGKNVAAAGPHDWFVATALTVRDRVVGEEPALDAKLFRRTANGIRLITQPMLDGIGA